MSQSASGHRREDPPCGFIESKTQATHTQRSGGSLADSRYPPDQDTLARTLGLPVRHAHRSGSVREYPLLPQESGFIEEAEEEDYQSSGSSNLGHGSVASSPGSVVELEDPAQNSHPAYNAAHNVRSRNPDRGSSSRNEPMSRELVTNGRESQGVNTYRADDRSTRRAAADSEASVHDESSADDVMPAVPYVIPRSSRLSRATYTPRRNPFEDDRSQGPSGSVRRTARPADENNRARPMNDIQDARRQMKEKNERLAHEKEMRDDGGNDAELRRFPGDGRTRMRRHTDGGWGREGSGVTARAAEPKNRDMERTDAPGHARFAEDLEGLQGNSSKHTLSVGLETRLQDLSVDGRDSHPRARTGLPMDRGTNSRAARTGRSGNHTISGSFPSAQASRRHQVDGRDGAGNGGRSNRPSRSPMERESDMTPANDAGARGSDMPRTSRSWKAGRRVDGGLETMPRRSRGFN
jgi:hypothetical protein